MGLDRKAAVTDIGGDGVDAERDFRLKPMVPLHDDVDHRQGGEEGGRPRMRHSRLQ